AGREKEVSVAAVNGPASVVISGTEEAVLEVAAALEERGVRTKRLRVSHAFHSPLMEPMLEDFRALARTLSYGPSQIPVVSTVTGQAATDEQLCSPDYWVDQVRQAVRFSDGVRTLHAQGVRAYLELGPDGVLTAMADDTLTALADADETVRSRAAAEGMGGYVDSDPVLVSALRGGQDEQATIMMALAGLHVHGVPVSWPAMFPGARRVELPTYAFQRQWFWPSGRRAGDAEGLGQVVAGHPLLGAAMGLADTDEALLTGRISLGSHPWLADHVVGGMVIFPGTGFLELVVRAGDEVGCDLVEELTLTAPLVLGADDAVAVQVRVGSVDGMGRREVSVHARPAGADDHDAWVRHAIGVLAVGGQAGERFDTAVWPPRGASVIELDGLYERLAGGGLGYGPVFQGLRGAWRGADGVVFAEVGLPGQVVDAGGFGLHPALLDAALHAVAFADLEGSEGVRLPFSWGGVCLHAGGASVLRVRLAWVGGDAVSLSAVDAAGEPVLSARSLVLRPISVDDLSGADGRALERDALFRLEWAMSPEAAASSASSASGPLTQVAELTLDLASDPEVELAALEVVPEVVTVVVGSAGDGDVVGAAHALTARVLGLVQGWLADERCADARLVVVTRGAVV
ncbi:polyketide synthase dehydratase domain-containing protein, partial [Streptosporangium sp. NPDC006013]|uniref:polyketide synthase dehydratase domain-containing protein n=1 Tax=Streptosporangium sp. NPDC006013 TaxID=3155596 RepID=UPI0033B30E7B